MRINARLDHIYERKLREIQARTGFSASEVVKKGLDILHKAHAGQPEARLKALLASSFIGCADGPADLATEYKRYLTESLESKHGTG